jgi:hypothetical protein
LSVDEPGTHEQRTRLIAAPGWFCASVVHASGLEYLGLNALERVETLSGVLLNERYGSSALSLPISLRELQGITSVNVKLSSRPADALRKQIEKRSQGQRFSAARISEESHTFSRQHAEAQWADEQLPCSRHDAKL